MPPTLADVPDNRPAHVPDLVADIATVKSSVQFPRRMHSGQEARSSRWRVTAACRAAAAEARVGRGSRAGPPSTGSAGPRLDQLAACAARGRLLRARVPAGDRPATDFCARLAAERPGDSLLTDHRMVRTTRRIVAAQLIHQGRKPPGIIKDVRRRPARLTEHRAAADRQTRFRRVIPVAARAAHDLSLHHGDPSPELLATSGQF